MYELPALCPRRVVDAGIVDGFALGLLPNYAKPLCPVLTDADGNCVPKALSLEYLDFW